MNHNSTPPSRKQNPSNIGMKKFPTDNPNPTAKTEKGISNDMVAHLGVGDRLSKEPVVPFNESQLDEEVAVWNESNPDFMEDDPPVVAEQQAPKTPNLNVNSRSQHPVLKRLRQSFGLELIKTFDVNINDTIWTIGPISQDLLSFSVKLADRMSTTTGEHALKFSIARAASAVRLIDKVQVWKVFNIKQKKDDDVTNPLNPPERLQKLAIAELYDLFSLELKSGISGTILDAYAKNIEPFANIDIESGEQKANYRCPECGTDKWLEERKTEGGELIPYYCEFDGTVMEPLITKEEAEDYPLA